MEAAPRTYYKGYSAGLLCGSVPEERKLGLCVLCVLAPALCAVTCVPMRLVEAAMYTVYYCKDSGYTYSRRA